ncbi:MAG: hypothetical protein HUU14_12140 [Dehalococcoidia bacterium]|nr:alkylmercury lyase family protein [Dehalococcoidia bacterium]MCL4231894.1 alkylmercury lyase family protein [Dehalococcoidia bacterium]NUQ56629.1 hypothetical protein [Dehalococcoidia bacterium]RIL04370.1 MAG: hypothetical protein DCC78_01990 [bacterium]
MNLFRSEEHAKAWSRYEPESADGILPLAEWARIFSGPLFRDRLREDYLSRRGEGMAAFMQAIAGLAKTGPFWQPG